MSIALPLWFSHCLFLTIFAWNQIFDFMNICSHDSFPTWIKALPPGLKKLLCSAIFRVRAAGNGERHGGTPRNTNQFAGASGLRGRCDEGRNLGKLVLLSPIFQMGTYSFHYHDLKWFSLFGEFFYKLALLFASQTRVCGIYWAPIVCQALFSDSPNGKHGGCYIALALYHTVWDAFWVN